LVPLGGRRRWGSGEEGYKHCVHMYVKRKSNPIQTISGNGGMTDSKKYDLSPVCIRN
jgi:hypothetical protein